MAQTPVPLLHNEASAYLCCRATSARFPLDDLDDTSPAAQLPKQQSPLGSSLQPSEWCRPVKEANDIPLNKFTKFSWHAMLALYWSRSLYTVAFYIPAWVSKTKVLTESKMVANRSQNILKGYKHANKKGHKWREITLSWQQRNFGKTVTFSAVCCG